MKNRKVFLKNFVFLCMIWAIVACAKPSLHDKMSVTLPPKVPIPDAMYEIIAGLVDMRRPESFFGSQMKIAKRNILTPEDAYEQIQMLYPEKAELVECWTQVNEHFIFSLREVDKLRYGYFYILYLPIGGKKFGYFWPHT